MSMLLICSPSSNSMQEEGEEGNNLDLRKAKRSPRMQSDHTNRSTSQCIVQAQNITHPATRG